ncbi:hypothetical protein ABPG74_020008 [Tetrahymena malaccensis]
MDQHKDFIRKKLSELSDLKQKKKKNPIYNENQDEDIIRAKINRFLNGPKQIVNIIMIVINIFGLALCACQIYNRCLNLDYIILIFYFILACGPQIYLLLNKRFPAKFIGLSYLMYSIFYLAGAVMIILFFIQGIESIICQYEVCHQYYGGSWIKNNYRESESLCNNSPSKQDLKQNILDILTEYQNYPQVQQYKLDDIALIQFTSFYVFFNVLIITKIIYSAYLIICYIMILTYKKKHKQIFKKMKKDINKNNPKYIFPQY